MLDIIAKVEQKYNKAWGKGFLLARFFDTFSERKDAFYPFQKLLKPSYFFRSVKLNLFEFLKYQKVVKASVWFTS